MYHWISIFFCCVHVFFVTAGEDSCGSKIKHLEFLLEVCVNLIWWDNVMELFVLLTPVYIGHSTMFFFLLFMTLPNRPVTHDIRSWHSDYTLHFEVTLTLRVSFMHFFMLKTSEFQVWIFLCGPQHPTWKKNHRCMYLTSNPYFILFLGWLRCVVFQSFNKTSWL